MTRFSQLKALREWADNRPIAWHDDVIFGIVFGGASVLLVLGIIALLGGFA